MTQKMVPLSLNPIRLSHKLPTIYGSGMGMVWEASQKGVPFLGVPGNSLNVCQVDLVPQGHLWLSIEDVANEP